MNIDLPRFWNDRHESSFTTAASVVTAAFATEAIVRTVSSIGEAILDGTLSYEIGDALTLSGSCALLTLSTLNVVPGSAKTGALACTLFSLMRVNRSDSWLVGNLIGRPLDFFLESVATPLLARIGNVVEAALGVIVSLFSNFSVPNDAVILWTATLLLAVGGCLYLNLCNRPVNT